MGSQDADVWALHVHVYVKEEDRVKSNEIIVGRRSIAAVVAWYPLEDDIAVLLIKEFRSPAHGWLYGLPSGSGESNDFLTVEREELREECCLEVDTSRLKSVAVRQLASTLTVYQSHVYSLRLSHDEYQDLLARQGTMQGMIEQREITYIHMTTVKELSINPRVDWSILGMIVQATAEDSA